MVLTTETTDSIQTLARKADNIMDVYSPGISSVHHETAQPRCYLTTPDNDYLRESPDMVAAYARMQKKTERISIASSKTCGITLKEGRYGRRTLHEALKTTSNSKALARLALLQTNVSAGTIVVTGTPPVFAGNHSLNRETARALTENGKRQEPFVIQPSFLHDQPLNQGSVLSGYPCRGLHSTPYTGG
ncbi:hypothetical protein ISCGN_004561 [Ixodes scapularis]